MPSVAAWLCTQPHVACLALQASRERRGSKEQRVAYERAGLASAQSTSGAHIVCTMRTPPCTVRAHSWLTARHVIHRRAAGQLTDQISSPGDYLPVRVGPAFGIAPCVELWAKEFGGGWRVAPNTPIYTKYVRVAKGVQNGFLHPQTAQKNRCADLLLLMSALDSTDS